MITDKFRKLFGIKDNSKLLSRKEIRYVRDVKALALAGLEIVDYDNERLAKLLNINIEMLNNILKERAILNKKQTDKIRTNFAKRIALYDSLSSIENRMNFRATLYNLSESSTISLLFIKFNEFKEINERYGYETSDEILQQAASRVSQQYPCAYMTRIRQDKFCLIFANKNKYQSRQLVKDLESLVTSTYDLDLSGIQITPTTKTTLVNYPEDIKTLDEVIKITKTEY